MTQDFRITPTPGYQFQPRMERILPRPDFQARSLHDRNLPRGGMVEKVEVEFCPVCLGRNISERMIAGKPMWHCDDCENEW